MEWDKIISGVRVSREQALFDEQDFPGRKSIDKYFTLSPFEEDYQNVLSSSAFRAQQDKTQVFALDESDFIRTRLTHAMEVSAIARELGSMVVKKPGLCPEGKKEKLSSDVRAILATAGLLHDIGNPPFGHYGEQVISDWLKFHLSECVETYGLVCDEKLLDDLKRFEGNAQTFRILATGNYSGDMLDIRPTYSVLAAMTKYTACSSDAIGEDEQLAHHKLGYYQSEAKQFKKMAKELGMCNGNDIVRHPLAFLLEAADDIAYRTADFEDAVKKGLIPKSALLDIGETIDKECAEKTIEVFSYLSKLLRHHDDMEYVVHHWARNMRLLLMNSAAYVFYRDSEKIFSGKYQEELMSDSGCFHRETMAVLASLMGRYVYSSREVLEKEIAAKVVLETLLENMIRAAFGHIKRSEGKTGRLSEPNEKYYLLLSEEVRKRLDKTAENRVYESTRAVLDFISGLTDSGAARLFRLFAGQRI